MKKIKIYNLHTRSGRYRARKAGLDVPKLKSGSKPVSFEERLENIEKEFKGCWIWKGIKNNDGYGIYSENGKTKYIHRTIWEKHNQKSAKGLIIRHVCDKPACCSPYHLISGTHQDNQMDKVKRNRQAKGSKNGSSKLTETQVKEIKNEYGKGKKTYQDLAEQYLVCKSSIEKIIRRINWKSV